jgi:hypothetical protein
MRVLLVATLVVGAMIVADLLGPVAWFLVLLPVAVLGASFFVEPTPP